MAKVDTLPEYLKPMMAGVSIRKNHCVVCGKTYPLNQHHVVRRSAGKMYLHGKEVPKPTLTLCGSGNTSGCHGKAHAMQLHFRWVPQNALSSGLQSFGTFGAGHWEYLETEPMKEFEAQQIEDGWKPLV